MNLIPKKQILQINSTTHIAYISPYWLSYTFNSFWTQK